MNIETQKTAENLEHINKMQLALMEKWCDANGFSGKENESRKLDWIEKYSKQFRVFINREPNISIEAMEDLLYESVEKKLVA